MTSEQRDAAMEQQVAEAGHIDDETPAPTRDELAEKLRELNAGIVRLGGAVLISEQTGRAMEMADLQIAVSNSSHRLRILTDLT